MNELRGDPYLLDTYERSIAPDSELTCPDLHLETHRGQRVRFSPAVRVFEPFAQRLARFERVLVRVSQRYYARPPIRVVNTGGYFCRTVRHRPNRLSEHALGNAIDIVGFDFGPLAAKPAADASNGLPAPLRSRFSIRVESHWQDGEGALDVHARFLRALTRALDEQGVFRTMLGPAHPTHATHFHFDMAPYTHVRL
jgi:hypothetical protein